MSDPTRKKPLSEATLNEREFIKKYLKYKNGTKAALEVYDCKNEHSARSIASDILKKIDISDLLEEGGISDARLVKDIDEGLKATKEYVAGEKVVKVKDFAIRHKYVETALKLKKKLSPETTLVVEPKAFMVPEELAEKDGISSDAIDSS